MIPTPDIHIRDPFILAENGVYHLYAQSGNFERLKLFEVRETHAGLEIVAEKNA